METKGDFGNIWGMTDDEMEYYGKLSIQHQEYLPWLFVNYDEEAESNADNIKKSISILKNRKANIKVWQDCYKWNMEHERAKHFLGTSMSIHHLAMLIFPFLSQKQEYKIFCDAVANMICNQSMQASSFPWQGEYYQLVEPYIDQKKINALTDERSSIQLYSNLVHSDLKNMAKIAHSEFMRATVKNWHLSKCADIWTSYLEYMAIHGALPSRLHFGVEYRGEQQEISIRKESIKTYKLKADVLKGNGYRQRLFKGLFNEYAREVNHWRDLWGFAISGDDCLKDLIARVGIKEGINNAASVHKAFYDKERNKEWDASKFEKTFYEFVEVET